MDEESFYLHTVQYHSVINTDKLVICRKVDALEDHILNEVNQIHRYCMVSLIWEASNTDKDKTKVIIKIDLSQMWWGLRDGERTVKGEGKEGKYGGVEGKGRGYKNWDV